MIYLGCDHAGVQMKLALAQALEDQGLAYEDLGPQAPGPCPYPLWGHKVALAVQKDKAHRGILICGSGIGMSMVANRHTRVRAALCHSPHEATLSRQHNDSNVLCLGARVVSIPQALDILKAWLGAHFEGGRHRERLELFDDWGS